MSYSGYGAGGISGVPAFVQLLLQSNEYEDNNYDLKRGGQAQLVMLRHKQYGPVAVKVMDAIVAVRMAVNGLSPEELEQKRLEGAKWTAREIANVLVVQGHPNVVQVKEAGYIGPEMHPHQYFTITMEAAHSDLNEILSQPQYLNGLTEKDACHLFQQLAYAVHHLHSEGVMHRDIKPSNCLLFMYHEVGLVVKLADFGFSKSKNDSMCFTKAGTAEFAAPELLLESGYYDGYKVDIWSLGAVLYRMLHGYCPYGEGTPDQIRQRFLDQQRPLQFKAGLSLSVQNLINRMLDRNPQTRACMMDVINHEWVARTFYNSTAYILDKHYKFVDTRALKFANPQERHQLMQEVASKMQLVIQEAQAATSAFAQQQTYRPENLATTFQNQMTGTPQEAQQLTQQLDLITRECVQEPVPIGYEGQMFNFPTSRTLPDLDDVMAEIDADVYHNNNDQDDDQDNPVFY